MARKSKIDILVADTLLILSSLGVPVNGLSRRRQERMAKAFLAVSGMTTETPWIEVRTNNLLRSRDVIRWVNKHFKENISPGSYDDIRRKDLLAPVEAGLVTKSAGNEDSATNDGTRSYALSEAAGAAIRRFGSPQWDDACKAFLESNGNLAEELSRLRDIARIPISIDGRDLSFSHGAHNILQKAIIEDFLPRFGNGCAVLYVGDTENKYLYINPSALRDLGFFEISHDKLPDILAFSPGKNWLYVIEAVHSANPITEMRKRTIEQLTANCTASIVFVTAFPNRTVFRKFSSEIAWETEVWISDNPDHLVHFNGDKFLGPHLAKT